MGFSRRHVGDQGPRFEFEIVSSLRIAENMREAMITDVEGKGWKIVEIAFGTYVVDC
jgi:hypothetical protein